jgi:hypothetical protein
MKKLLKRRVHVLIPIAVLILAAVYLGACTPGSDITASESDVVVTVFDNKFNFGAVGTYAMPDSIFHLTDDPDNPDSDLISRKNDAEILALVESNFENRGYTKVDPGASPDFQVLVAVTAVEVWGVYSYYPWYPWYPGYPWYGWYYPPTVGASYQYTLGTLIIQMGEFFEEIPGEGETRTAYWMAAMNGVMDDTEQNRARRLTDGINQSFTQSPYLKSNQ